jgi:prepilin-type N-terminal cleavage/methylation domain-containing protein
LSQRQNNSVRGFTLIELIVVMVVMAILAGLSAIAYRGIAKDMQMSAAVNTVTAALDNARAIAIKNNRYVMTVFRPRLGDDGTTQFIELVIAEWTGDSASANNGTNNIWTYDRFVPVPKVLVRTISDGVNVAGPGYGVGDDDVWWVCSYLPEANEPKGALVGVLYSPEGRVVVRNAESGSDRIWVDYNRDWEQTIDATTSINWADPEIVTYPWTPEATPSIGSYFDVEIQETEPFVSMTPILAVFNEEECRKLNDTASWNDANYRDRRYTEYIDANADRIQFNRYSGAVLK